MATFRCVVCRSEFDRPPAHASRSPRGPYCSRRCFGRSERGKNNPGWIGGAAKVRCLNCKRQYQASPGDAPRRRFCSRTCIWAYYRKQRLITCPVCGAQLVRRGHRQRFCSRRCASISHRTAVLRQMNGRWKYGLFAGTMYGLAVWKELKRLVLIRDGRRCVVCKTDQRRLHVHHIDGSKTVSVPANLVSLCIPCHRKVHTKIGINMVWMSRFGSQLYAASRRQIGFTTS